MHGEQVLGGLLALSLLKKATAYGLARYYGFPRIYRKMLRFNRRVEPNPAHAKLFSDAMKTMFRLPNRVAASARGVSRRWRRTEVGKI